MTSPLLPSDGSNVHNVPEEGQQVSSESTNVGSPEAVSHTESKSSNKNIEGGRGIHQAAKGNWLFNKAAAAKGALLSFFSGVKGVSSNVALKFNALAESIRYKAWGELPLGQYKCGEVGVDDTCGSVIRDVVRNFNGKEEKIPVETGISRMEVSIGTDKGTEKVKIYGFDKELKELKGVMESFPEKAAKALEEFCEKDRLIDDQSITHNLFDSNLENLQKAIAKPLTVSVKETDGTEEAF